MKRQQKDMTKSGTVINTRYQLKGLTRKCALFTTEYIKIEVATATKALVEAKTIN